MLKILKNLLKNYEFGTFKYLTCMSNYLSNMQTSIIHFFAKILYPLPPPNYRVL